MYTSISKTTTTHQGQGIGGHARDAHQHVPIHPKELLAEASVLLLLLVVNGYVYVCACVHAWHAGARDVGSGPLLFLEWSNTQTETHRVVI
jgi:hypothetical protein